MLTKLSGVAGVTVNVSESFFVGSASDVATTVTSVDVSSIAIVKYPYSSIPVYIELAPSTDHITSLLICVPVTTALTYTMLPATLFVLISLIVTLSIYGFSDKT